MSEYKAWLYEVVRDDEVYRWIEVGTTKHIEDRTYDLLNGGACMVTTYIEDFDVPEKYLCGYWRKHASTDVSDFLAKQASQFAARIRF